MPNSEPPSADDRLARRVRRKVFWRIVPLIFLLYIVAYLDRSNLSFAKLQMQSRLGFSEPVFGWGAGLFSVGYLLLEIPGAIFVERWSARKWFTRILVTWGLCSMGMALVRTPAQFYTARILLGLAEAGFFPGVIVYFTHWFPRAERARALAGLVLGVPMSLALGARVSGYLLTVDWFGLDGWQWVFIAEGAPAVILGIVVLFMLNDHPRDARWLTAEERAWLEGTLERERAEATAGGRGNLSAVLREPAVWLLALGIFAANTGGFALVFWLPTTVKNLLGEMGRAATDSDVLDWTVIVFICGLVGVWLAGQSSDRTGERKWHCAAGMGLTGLFLAASALPGQGWSQIFVWLCIAGFFAYSWPPPFWVLPTQALSASAAAISVGLINMCANIAGLVGNAIIGEMRGAGIGDRTCLFFLAGCYAFGGAVISLVRVRKTSSDTPNSQGTRVEPN
jgi:MFS transporter, ACS family, tartrate transporter